MRTGLQGRRLPLVLGGQRVLVHTGVLAGSIGGKLDLGIRNQRGWWSLVVEFWKVVWGKKARTRALFDLEVVALRIDLGSGRGTVPDGIGFVVVLGALHGWPNVLDWVMVLDVAEALVDSMVPQMTKQSERSVVPLKAPEAGAVIVEVIEGWATPTVDSGTMCDATFLVTESNATVGARELQLQRFWRWRAKIFEFVNSKCVEHIETIIEMSVGGGGNVLSLGFEFEGTVDKRAPFGCAITDNFEKIMIGCGAIVRDAAK